MPCAAIIAAYARSLNGLCHPPDELRMLGRPKRDIIFPVSRQLIRAEAERKRRAERRLIEAQPDHICVVAGPRAAGSDRIHPAIDKCGGAWQPAAHGGANLVRAF